MWKNQEWLDAGGAEIVLESVRRMGWTVEVESAEEWGFLPDIVAAGDREKRAVWVNGEISPWLQAVAVAAIADSRFKRSPKYGYRECMLPFFYNGERLDTCDVYEIDRFIDRVKFSSDATISLMVSANGA